MKNPLSTIIHISDLHFSREIKTDKTQLKQALASIPSSKTIKVIDLYGHGFSAAYALSNFYKLILRNRKKNGIPIGVVFSGDLTKSGKSYEFDTGVKYLRRAYSFGSTTSVGFDIGPDQNKIDASTCPGLFCVPGNHDTWGQSGSIPTDYFKNHFCYTYPQTWTIKTNGRPIYIHGLDSTRTPKIDRLLARGHIHQSQLADLKDLIARIKSKDPKAINLVILHHPITDIGHKKTMRLDDYDKIAQLLSDDVELVLSGHIHENKIVCQSIKTPHHSVAGTATQICSKKNCILMDIYEDNIVSRVFTYDETVGSFLTDGKKTNFPI